MKIVKIEKEIRRCLDCPFLDKDFDREMSSIDELCTIYYCAYASSIELVREAVDCGIPTWCPLPNKEAKNDLHIRI